MSESIVHIDSELAAKIRLVIFDVDGVMTDGGIYLGSADGGDKVEMKRFEITDGLGIHLLQMAGVEVAIVTGRESNAVRLRAEELGVTEYHQDATAHKLPIVLEMMERLGVGWDEIAFLGDDLADLVILKRVGLPAGVANAVPEVRALARWAGTKRGGAGAVREFAEALLYARGEWAALVDGYVAEREALK